MNWRAGGAALLGAFIGGAGGIFVGKAAAQRLALPEANGRHKEFTGQSMLVGASIGAIIGASLASDDPKPPTST
jgi:uncharacterized membrane protein YfcA